MSTLVTANYGAGKQLQSFADIRDFVGANNLTGDDKTIVIYLYEKLVYNQANVGASPQPVNPGDLHNVMFIVPPGLSVNDLEKTKLDYGASGVEIEFGRDSRTLFAGLSFYGLRILFTGGSGGRGFITQNKAAALSKYDVEFHDCRFLDQSTSGGVVMYTGVFNTRTLFSNCLFITEGSQAQMVGDTDATHIENCRFIARGNGSAAPTAIGLSNFGFVTSTDFIGFGATPIQGGYDANISYCRTDSPAGGRGTGLTVATTAQLVQDYAGKDYRPAGVAIGGGNPLFAATADMLGNNRGPAPDSGPWQFTAAVALPTGTFSSQPTPDGQNLTVSFSTANIPTSAAATLVPSSTNPDGAVANTGTATLGTNTGTATFTNIHPGNYVLVVTLTNSGGSTNITGNTSVSVVGIDANTQAPGGSGTPVPDTTIPVMVGTLAKSNITTTDYTVTWQAATDNTAVAGYEFSSDGGTNYTAIGNVLTYTKAGNTPNTTYNIAVRAFDTSMNKAVALTTTVKTALAPDTTAPVMSGSVAASNVTQTSATITWQAATDGVGVTGYERSTDGGNTYTDVGLVLTSAITGLTQNTVYQVKVRAYDAAGNRATPIATSLTTASAADSTPPSMSGSLTVTNVTQTGANLSWVAGTDNVSVTGYEYSLDGGTAYTDLGLVLLKALTGLEPSTTYQVRVRAYDSSANKSLPLSAQITTLAAADTTAPTMVGTVSVGAISQTTLALSWQAATDNVAVTGYEYSLDGGIVYTSVGNVLGVTAINLTPDVPYSIRVRAFDAAGNRSIPLSVSARTAANASSFTPSVARTVAVQPSAPNFITGKFWTMVAGAPRGPKDPDSTIDITFDWSAWLADMGGSSIAKVKFTLQGVQDAGSYATGSKTTVFVSGGSVGTAAVSCRITTDSMPARVDERTVYLDLGEQ